jgi:hypothetical protein
MTQEEEFEELKADLLQSYADYYEVIRNLKLSHLNEFNELKHLVETYVLSVDANTNLRNFISKYRMISTTGQKELEPSNNKK